MATFWQLARQLRLVAIAATLLACRDVSASEPAGNANLHLSEEQKQVVEGFRRGLDRITSGECLIVEHNSRGNQTKKMRSVFDYESARFRFDTEIVGRHTYRLVLTPTEMLLYVGGDHAIHRYPREGRIPISYAAPIELRTIGRSGIGDYLNRTPSERLVEFSSDMLPVAVEKIGEAWKLTLVKDYSRPQKMGPTVHMRTWRVVTVAPEFGFLPTADTWFQKGALASLGDDLSVTQGKLVQTAEYEWEKRDNVVVPKHVVFQASPDADWTIDVTFEWKSVNAPPKADVFSPNDFDVEPGTRLVDDRDVQPK